MPSPRITRAAKLRPNWASDWRNTYGPFEFVVTDLQGTRAGYHAQEDIPAILYHWGTIEKQFDRPYDLLILSRGTTPRSEDPMIEAAAMRMGLKRIAVPARTNSPRAGSWSSSARGKQDREKGR